MGLSPAETGSSILFLILSPTPRLHSHPPISSPSQTSPRILSSNHQSAPTQTMAYGPAQSPHDLIQLDCYFYRLVLRSISQECYIHCHAGYSQGCSADGAFLEFYGTTHGPLSSISDPTLSRDQRKALEGSLPAAALSPPCLPTNPSQVMSAKAAITPIDRERGGCQGKQGTLQGPFASYQGRVYELNNP